MIVGIDLGTTNSLVAVWKDGDAQIVPNALGHGLTPSVVGLDDNGEVLIGMAARDRLLTHPELTTATFKRHMGSDREMTLGGTVKRKWEEDGEKLAEVELFVKNEKGKNTTPGKAVVRIH